jgi:phage terminase large subunit
MRKIQLSEKQKLALDLINDNQVVDVLFGGGAGGGKSILSCIWMVLRCRDYPGIRIGLGRKELTRLKQTTVQTLLREAHPLLGVKPGEFVYSDHKGTIQYINGSVIQLVDLAYLPSDPNFDRFGSFNFTDVVIEEVGEVAKKAKDIFTSRKNRFMNDKYHIVGKSIATCNPSQNYIKTEYYKPFKNLGGGEFQKWEYGKVEIDGALQAAYRAFVPSLAIDNPYIPRNYIEVLRKLPTAERKRLLEGNWDFEDNDKMVFPSSVIDRSIVDRYEAGEVYLSLDIADTGSDDTILSHLEVINDVVILVDQFPVPIDKQGDIGDQIALFGIKYAQQHGVDASKARNIAIDGIGVATSTRDSFMRRGWYVQLFMAGAAASNPTYKNLRQETIYEMGQKMAQGKVKIYSGCRTLDKLREQLMAHEYTTEERTIVIKSKKLIKEAIGRSPDHAESMYIGCWVASGNKDPKNDIRRIAF